MKDSKTKSNKMVFVYGLIMLACVVVMIVIGFATSPEHDSESSPEGQNLIDEKQNNVRLLEEKVSELEGEIETLKVEKNKYIGRIEELEQQIQNQPSETTVAELKTIFETYKSGAVDEAKEAFEQLDPTGYDEVSLAYYEILKEVIEN